MPKTSLMPKTREQIKHERQHALPYISPHFGDGGWHTTPGALSFDPKTIQPFGDHILVAIDSESESEGMIAKPDIARNVERNCRIGTVLKVGPGEWKDSKTHKGKHIGIRIPMTLKPGDRVVVGQYSDWESWDADYEGRGANICIFQEADVRGVLS